MSGETEFLTVKDVAEMLDTEPYVLRFYEKELNLDIKRNSKGHRVYSLEDIELLRKVKDMREKGLQLKAIGTIVHSPSNEVKETYEQLSGIGLLPVESQSQSEIAGVDISNPDDEKVKQFQNMMVNVIKQAMSETQTEAKMQIKEEVKAEIVDEVKTDVDEKLAALKANQDSKNEEYYRKLDETMREVQQMRKRLGEEEEKSKKKKQSMWNKLFGGSKKSAAHNI